MTLKNRRDDNLKKKSQNQKYLHLTKNISDLNNPWRIVLLYHIHRTVSVLL